MTAYRKGAARLGIALAVMAMLASVAIPSYAQGVSTGPLVELANPNAGAYLRRGKVIFTGNACDPNATDAGVVGTGIKRISAYFGDRDTLAGTPSWRPGGYLTAASLPNVTQPGSQLGMPSTSPLCKVPNAGFQLVTPSLKKGTYDLNIYALSTSGAETHIVIPRIRVDKP